MPMKTIRFAPLALVLVAGCADPSVSESEAVSPDSPDAVSIESARVIRSEAGKLTGPSSAAPALVASNFLLDQIMLTSENELRVEGTSTSANGVTHVRFNQVVEGLRVFGVTGQSAYARVAVSPRGEVIQAIEALEPDSGRVVAPAVDAAEALAVAMENLSYWGPVGRGLALRSVQGSVSVFEKSEEFYRAPTVERVAVRDQDGSLLTGYLVETWSQHNNRLHHTLVSGFGELLKVELRTNTDRYNVFIEGPDKGPQTVVNGPGSGNAESPAGWLGTGSQNTNSISGNNVSAYLDSDANNGPDSGGTAVTNGDFLTAVDLAAVPTTAGNKAVAAQNLFYLNNVVHDTLYRSGFTEANLNFQVNNFGKGGLGNDPVLAEAQDGSGTDNANFSTPSDGSSPRMQMYLWTGSTPTALVTVSGVVYNAYASTFGAAPTSTGITGALALYVDASGDTNDGCETATVSLKSKVALVTRGTCDFTVKVKNAQSAGATAVIIANNVEGSAFAPGGTNRLIKIPSAMVTLADANILRTKAGVSTNLKKNPAPNIQLDGDLDADIVFHEYGHGLTWRMIGSMSGGLAGAIGEGASDVLAFLINGDDVIGEYSYGKSGGIRRYPYTNYPLTYADATTGQVHSDGEIYAGAMWRVRENYLAAGLTIDTLLKDFVDGMNYTQATPAFEDMRDGMLQSAAGTGRECLIWRGFAASGVGVGADGAVSRTGAVTITESFTLPTTCP